MFNDMLEKQYLADIEEMTDEEIEIYIYGWEEPETQTFVCTDLNYDKSNDLNCF